MGKLLNGPFGPTTGTTGNLTSYLLNGQNVIRMITHSRTRSSEKQLNNEQRMTVINDFFYHLKPLLKAGFENAAKHTTSNYYNLATSYNKKHALKGFYPNVEIDFPKLLISTGDLLPAENPAVTRIAEGLKFTWKTDGYNWDNGPDQVMLLAYFPEVKKAMYLKYGAKRSAGQEILQLSASLMDQPAETYLSFVSEDRSAVATSIYMGRVE